MYVRIGCQSIIICFLLHSTSPSSLPCSAARDASRLKDQLTIQEDTTTALNQQLAEHTTKEKSLQQQLTQV